MGELAFTPTLTVIASESKRIVLGFFSKEATLFCSLSIVPTIELPEGFIVLTKLEDGVLCLKETEEQAPGEQKEESESESEMEEAGQYDD
ncbi:hypothetical protein ACHAXT_005104 [Thalassiosira profunda]